MKARSIKGSSPHVIQASWQQGIDDGFKPTLTIVKREINEPKS